MKFFNLSKCWKPMLPLLVLGLTACGATDSGGETEAYADFITFYERFHRDSAYQMAHILFPLQGLPPAGDTSAQPGQPFFWTRENWSLHRPFDANNPDFERTIHPLAKDLMEERITHRSRQFGMLRRWARLDDDWFLVFYAPPGRIGPPNGGS